MATQMLREGESSITEIAGSLGYQDAANFTRAFRTRSGITPSSYRQSFRAAAADRRG